jgi:hypothetical protein
MVLPGVLAYGFPLAAFTGTERELYPIGFADSKPGVVSRRYASST